MPAIIAGQPGTTWTNTTGKVVFQFRADWTNTCALCAQFDGMIGPLWPIPKHPNCRCKNLPVFPGGSSQPFTDFAAKIAALPDAEKTKLAGAAVAKLVATGLVSWSDAVTPARVKTLAEVVAAKGLTANDMAAAGVPKATADAAIIAAEGQTPQSLAASAMKSLADFVAAKQSVIAKAAKAVLGKLAAGAKAVAKAVTYVTAPLSPEVLGAALGLKLKPPKDTP